MSAFLRRFLREDDGLFSRSSGKRIFLAAFGKHPGWDDHLDDIGLETESLILLKQKLYLEGIASQISAGAWEKLPEELRLAEFEHVFLWQRCGRMIAGRMWSSQDGKGRGRFPMTICCQCENIAHLWAFNEVFTRLETLEQSCRATEDPDAVRAAISGVLAELRQVAAEAPGPDEPEAFQRWVCPPLSMDPDATALMRALWQVRDQFAALAPSRLFPLQLDVPASLRLPGWAGLPLHTLHYWSTLLRELLDDTAPVLLFLPQGGDWVDVIAGEPAPEQFFALRAASGALPMADAMADASEEPWRERVRDLLFNPPPDASERALAKAFWRG
jgi:hypothetical protein